MKLTKKQREERCEQKLLDREQRFYSDSEPGPDYNYGLEDYDLTRKEYEARTNTRKDEVRPSERKSEDTYYQPNILNLETSRLYKDGDDWCYKASE